jgi:ABC-2 type transport system ATP-binding protein
MSRGPMADVIETEDLTRRFGRKEAVAGLTLRVPSGSIYAFLGPNGAGKTTMIRLLLNVLEPTRGEARILGTRSVDLGPAEFSRIGYVSEDPKLPAWMTVSQLVAYCAPLYPTWDDRFCRKLIDDLDIPLDERIRHLSRGMRVKTALLVALAYRPEILILDEPFAGLDPFVRDELLRGVLEWTGAERWSVFVSSQDIEEVERLADWVGLLMQGRIITAEPISSLQSRFRQVEVVLGDATTELPPLPAGWIQHERSGRTLRFVESRYREGESERAAAELFPKLNATFAPMSLREIFLTLVRKP